MSLPSLQSLKGNPLARGKNSETLLVKEESFVKIERRKQTKKLLLMRTTLLVINLTLLLLTFIHDDLITRLILPLCRESERKKKRKTKQMKEKNQPFEA